MADSTKVGDLMNNPALWSMIGGMGAALSPKDTWARDLGSFTSNVFSNAAFRKNMLKSQGKEVGDLKSLLDYGFASPEQQLATYKESPEYLEAEKGRRIDIVKQYGTEQRTTDRQQSDIADIKRREEADRYKDLPVPKNIKTTFGEKVENMGQLISMGFDPKDVMTFSLEMDRADKAGMSSKVSAIGSLLGVRSELVTNMGMGFTKSEEAQPILDLIDKLLPAFAKDAGVVIPDSLLKKGKGYDVTEDDLGGGSVKPAVESQGLAPEIVDKIIRESGGKPRTGSIFEKLRGLDLRGLLPSETTVNDYTTLMP